MKKQPKNKEPATKLAARRNKGATTRPGTLPPEFLELLPAVVAALRRGGIPGTTIAGCGVAADALDDMVAGRDPRMRFDAGKSTRRRDMIAGKVMDCFRAGRCFADAVKEVAAELATDEVNVRRHLRNHLREIWPGSIVHVREDGTREAWPKPLRSQTDID